MERWSVRPATKAMGAAYQIQEALLVTQVFRGVWPDHRRLRAILFLFAQRRSASKMCRHTGNKTYWTWHRYWIWMLAASLWWELPGKIYLEVIGAQMIWLIMGISLKSLNISVWHSFPPLSLTASI